jgi:hypothetical protein
MYDASTSLNQNIATLSDKSKQVNNAILINLIAKYFFAYAYPESVDQKIPLAEIDEKFARATRCCKGSKEAGIIDVVGDLSIEELMFYKTFYEA